MMRKVVLLGGIAAAALAVASQWPDISRYLKIRQMSSGQGHPENVPAGGSHQYRTPGQAAHRSAREFGSAARGGPATAG